MNKITCIIAAYNEEKRIANVLKVVSKCSFIEETIVVNDGSKDNTDRIVKQFKNIKLISYKKNRGKTSALLKGIKAAKGNYILLLDADLIGLRKENILALIKPVIKNEADATISLRHKNKLSYNIFDLLVLLSGERAFKKDILDYNKFYNLPGYGFESVFNLQAIDKKFKIKFIPMPNVDNTAKMEKIGFFRGIIKEIGMLNHIIRAVGFIGCVKQVFLLRRLSID